MARKKKSKGTLSQKQAVENHTEVAVTATRSQPLSLQTTVVDVLSVRLVPSSSSSSRKRSVAHRIPHILISDPDASLLNLGSGEEIFLLRCGTTTTGAAVGRAELWSNSLKRKSTGPPDARATAPLLPGTIQVVPVSLINAIFGGSLEQQPSSEEVTAQPTTPRSPAPTPTATKTGFSFKSGGGSDGGDQIYSPATPSSPIPQLRTSNAKLPTEPLWIVPLRSKFGRCISRRVCFEASRIVIQPVTVSSLDTDVPWQRSLQMVQRLVLAYYVDQYVQRNEILHISFQGKPLDLVVVLLEAFCVNDGNDIGSTTTDLSNLRLDENDDMVDCKWSQAKTTVWDAVRSSDSLRLYKVHYGTEVKCRQPPDVLTTTVTTKEDSRISRSATSSQTQSYPVAGLSKTQDELRSLLQTPLNHRQLFARAGIQPPKGVLLHGPSGVGKTSLARLVAKEFQEASCTVEFVNCTSLQSKTAIVGEAERYLAKCFRKCSSDQGKLLIFDDIHLICPKRGGPASGGTDRLAATLLAQLDGIGSKTDDDSVPLVVLAITNNPSLLDPALRRNGRLDAEVEVPLPDEASTRVEILKCQLERLGVSVPDIDEKNWLSLGKLAKGFNGADCSLAVKEAVRSALLRDLTLSKPRNELTSHRALDLHVEDLRASIRATTPSAIKSITVEIPQVKWCAIGGMESVKTELRDAIELPLLHPETFKALGIPSPRGILLYGRKLTALFCFSPISR
jgi:ATP-dependent 26S proteasome regulatory subunit